MPETVTVTVERQMPLAYSLASRYFVGAGTSDQQALDRLVEVARTGLVRAVDRLGHLGGWSFTLAAVPLIIAELRRDARERNLEAQQLPPE